MSSVWYVGNSDRRVIDFSLVGVGTGVFIWDKSNGWSVNQSVLSGPQISLLNASNEFQVTVFDGPRPGSSASADNPVHLTRSEMLEAMESYGSSSLRSSRKYRTRPRKTVQTNFQPGHGWTANVGTWTADTSDFRLGSQSIRVTAPNTGVGQTYRRLAQSALDLTNKNFAMLVKVDEPANLQEIQLYLGTSSLANFIPLIAAGGGASANSTIPPNEWTWVHFSWADAGNMVGTVDKALITDWQFRVVGLNGGPGPVTVWCNSIVHYPKQNIYPGGVVSLAFDDNFDTQFSNARPVLDALGLGATSFTIVDSLGTAGFMTRAQLDRLQDSHGWEVGGHAYTLAAHNAGFSTLSPGSLATEVRSLRNWLHENGYNGADLFAYPLGDENATVRASIGQYFTLARQIIRKPLLPLPLDQPLRVRSYSVSQSDSLATVQSVVDKANANGTWLILTFHRIVSGAPSAGTEWAQSDLQSLLNYVAGKNMPIETIGQVLDTVR